MSPRERFLLLVLVAILAVGGALILGYQWFYRPLTEYNKTIRKLIEENDQKEGELRAVLADRKLLEQARLRSLPGKPDVALAEYGKYLQPLLRDSGLVVETLQPALAEARPAATNQPGKKHTHQTLTFQVRAKGELENLVKALDKLQHTPLLHRVRNLTVDRIDSSAKATGHRLNVSMTVEALIVGRNESRPDNLFGIDPRLLAVDGLAALHRGPTGLALVPWAVGPTGPVAQRQLAEEAGYRRYADLAKRNLFVGALPPPPAVVKEEKPAPDEGIEITEYVRLETTNVDGKEAFFRNLLFKMPPIRIRAVPRSGYDSFRIMNELRDKTLVRGKVLRVDQRDVYFQVGEDIYGVHIGQTLAEAMRRPLSNDELDELNLTGLYDSAWASASQEERRPKTKGARAMQGRPGR